MQAIDKQMQDLLEKMQRHNQLVGAQHLRIETSQKVHFFHKPAQAADRIATAQKPLEWPHKIDFSLFDQVLHTLLLADCARQLLLITLQIHCTNVHIIKQTQRLQSMHSR